MTPSIRPLGTRWIAALMLAGLGCDAAAPDEPDIELREGQTATFKTANQDVSFKWKGCEPPWGPEPYRPETGPTEEWIESVGKRMDRDVGANALGAWLDADGGRTCEEGCASLELAWTGEAQVLEPRAGVREARAIGRCDDKAIAWSVEVTVSSEIACTCGG